MPFVQDSKYVAFKDRNPASRYHFLVVPKKHIGMLFSQNIGTFVMTRDIGNVKFLGRSDATMCGYFSLDERMLTELHPVREMRDIGNQLMHSNGVPPTMWR